jgi:hypothetical protein
MARLNGNKDEYLKELETHFINANTFESMIKDDFEGFIEERNKLIHFGIRIKVYDRNNHSVFVDA